MFIFTGNLLSRISNLLGNGIDVQAILEMFLLQFDVLDAWMRTQMSPEEYIGFLAKAAVVNPRAGARVIQNAPGASAFAGYYNMYTKTAGKKQKQERQKKMRELLRQPVVEETKNENEEDERKPAANPSKRPRTATMPESKVEGEESITTISVPSPFLSTPVGSLLDGGSPMFTAMDDDKQETNQATTAGQDVPMEGKDDGDKTEQDARDTKRDGDTDNM